MKLVFFVFFVKMFWTVWRHLISDGHLWYRMTTVSVTDVAKFHHFCKILREYLVFSEISTFFGKHHMLLGTFYLLQMTKYLKNQFSHLVTLTTAVRLLCKRLRRTTTTRRRSARSRNVQCQIVLCRAVGKRPLFCSQPTNNGLT